PPWELSRSKATLNYPNLLRTPVNPSARLCPQSGDLIRGEPAFGQRHGDLLSLTVANDREHGDVVRLEREGHDTDDVVRSLDGDAVDRDYYVTAGGEAADPEDVDVVSPAAQTG